MATTPMPGNEELPGNSHISMDEQHNIQLRQDEASLREDDVNKKASNLKLQGKVNTERKSLGQKFVSAFVKEDANDIKEYIWFDVVLPKLKEIISETVNNSIDMLLYGEQRSRPNMTRNRGTSYVSYSAPYRNQNDGRPHYSDMRDRRGSYNLSNLIFDTRSDAEEVLGNLCDLVDDYRMASVSDFYKFSGMEDTSTYMDRKWGWYDLSMARVVRVRDGYSIDMPRPQQLDV